MGRSRQWAEKFLHDVEQAIPRLGKEKVYWRAFQELSAPFRKRFDLISLIHQWCYIDSDEGGRMPLILRRGPRLIVRTIQRYWRRNKPLRMVILKSRRQGSSTAIQASDLMLSVTNPYWKSLSLADKDDHTQTLIDIKRFGQQNLRFGPLLDRCWERVGSSGKPRLMLPRPLFGKVEFETAGGKNVGRSKGYRFVHRSETAFMDNVKHQNKALKATVPKKGFSVIVDESTANGAGGPFYQAWHSALRPETRSVPIFLSYLIDPRCQMEVPEQSLHEFDWSNLSEDEQFLVKELGATIPQLAFRRFVIFDEYDGDVDSWNQEYPWGPEVAFFVSGQQVFDKKTLLAMAGQFENMDGNFITGDLYRLPDSMAKEYARASRTKLWRREDIVARGPVASMIGGTPLPTRS